MAKKDLFYDLFAGEYVRVISKLSTQEQIQTEESVTQQEHPIVFEGYLLDVDDDYYYLGDTDQAIDRAIARRETVGIAISAPDVGFTTTSGDEVH